jgi:ribosomal-protein-alanine N-acetyltransferase
MMKTIELFNERLKLRLIEFSDLNAIHNLHSLPETDQYNTLGIPESIAVTKKVITPLISDNQQQNILNYSFAVEELRTGTFIGLLGFKLGSKKYSNVEVYYKLNKAYWGNGYATEAVNLVLDFGFKNLKLHRITAGCAIDNIASIKVLEKVGMKREGHAKQTLPLKSGWSDNYEYAILETDERKNVELKS